MSLTNAEDKKPVRILAIWFGSFLVSAVFLIAWFHVPPFPIIVAGVVTLAATLFKTFKSK